MNESAGHRYINVVGSFLVRRDLLHEFEQSLEKKSDQELLAYAKKCLSSAGDESPTLTLQGVNTSREGLLDLLVGMYAVGAITESPDAGGGRNNSPPPMV